MQGEDENVIEEGGHLAGESIYPGRALRLTDLFQAGPGISDVIMSHMNLEDTYKVRTMNRTFKKKAEEHLPNVDVDRVRLSMQFFVPDENYRGLVVTPQTTLKHLPGSSTIDICCIQQQNRSGFYNLPAGFPSLSHFTPSTVVVRGYCELPMRAPGKPPQGDPLFGFVKTEVVYSLGRQFGQHVQELNMSDVMYEFDDGPTLVQVFRQFRRVKKMKVRVAGRLDDMLRSVSVALRDLSDLEIRLDHPNMQELGFHHGFCLWCLARLEYLETFKIVSPNPTAFPGWHNHVARLGALVKLDIPIAIEDLFMVVNPLNGIREIGTVVVANYPDGNPRVWYPTLYWIQPQDRLRTMKCYISDDMERYEGGGVIAQLLDFIMARVENLQGLHVHFDSPRATQIRNYINWLEKLFDQQNVNRLKSHRCLTTLGLAGNPRTLRHATEPCLQQRLLQTIVPRITTQYGWEHQVVVPAFYSTELVYDETSWISQEDASVSCLPQRNTPELWGIPRFDGSLVLQPADSEEDSDMSSQSSDTSTYTDDTRSLNEDDEDVQREYHLRRGPRFGRH